MKNQIVNRKGIAVYTTFKLYKFDKKSIAELKVFPKECMVQFCDIVSICTVNIDNWIEVKTHENVYYEDRSLTNFINIARNSGYTFEKISKTTAISINLTRFKSNLSVIEMINGDVYEVKRAYKERLRLALLKVWEK